MASNELSRQQHECYGQVQTRRINVEARIGSKAASFDEKTLDGSSKDSQWASKSQKAVDRRRLS